MSNSRLATASVALDRTYMPSQRTATDIFCFCKVAAGEVRVACPIVGLQLQVSPSTTTACLLGLAFFVGEGEGAVACPIVGLQRKCCPQPQLHAYTPDCKGHLCCKWAAEERDVSCMCDSRLEIASVALDCNCKSPSRLQRALHFLLERGRGSCMSNSRLATTSVALDHNRMPTHSTTTNNFVFLRGRRERGASCMSDTRLGTPSVALDRNCMSPP